MGQSKATPRVHVTSPYAFKKRGETAASTSQLLAVIECQNARLKAEIGGKP